MKLTVLVKPGARKDEVTVREDGSLLVRVHTKPVEGKANKKVIEVLAQHFGKPKSSISIVSGLKSKRKVIEVS